MQVWPPMPASRYLRSIVKFAKQALASGTLASHRRNRLQTYKLQACCCMARVEVSIPPGPKKGMPKVDLSIATWHAVR